MNINRYALCKERSLQKIISKQPKPNTTAIGVCSETQVTHHIITKRSDECLPISAYVPKHKEGDGKKFPVIIDIYGGDFVAGRSALNRNFGTWCAEHGYLTFIPEYTPVPETNLFGNVFIQSVIGIALCRMSGISLTQQLAFLRIYASSSAARLSIVRTAATASGSVCQISYSLIPGIPIKTSGLR